MGDYAKRVSETKLFKQFDVLTDVEDVSAAEVSELKALVCAVADAAGPHLDHIRNTFWQYTEHDLRHLCNIADLIFRFLPKTKIKRKKAIRLNAVELAMLWLSILLHDIGMYVSEAEKQDILDSDEYRRFLQLHANRVDAAAQSRKDGLEVRSRAIEDAILAEYIREIHPERAGQYIRGKLDHLVSLKFRTISLVQDVADLCESHGWGVRQENDSRYPDKAVIKLNRKRYIGVSRVNLQYVACCLRLGDILDFDRTRTPLTVYDEIDFTEQASIDEWNKHLSVQGWRVDEHQVTFSAECTHPAYFVAVHDFLNWVDDELREWHFLADETPANDIVKYAIQLMPMVDRRQVRMENRKCLAGGFRFRLEYDEIMRLLMDKSLYPDSALFLRELLQNALDACRYQHALAKEANMADKYEPRIVVWDYSKVEKNPRIVFMDNGIGMSQRTVEDFFLRVGKSFYRSAHFKAERQRLEDQGIHLDACSQFGIGFLSCFLGGDRIEVETYHFGDVPLKITITGRSKYFVIEQLDPPSDIVQYASPTNLENDGPPYHPGTRVTVYLNQGWRHSDMEPNNGIVYETLDKFAVNQEYELWVFRGEQLEDNKVASKRWTTASPLVLRLSSYGTPPPNVLAPFEFPLDAYSEDLSGQGAFYMLDDGHGRESVVVGDLGLQRWRSGRLGLGVTAADLIFASNLEEISRREGKGQRSLWRKYLEQFEDEDMLESHPPIKNSQPRSLKNWGKVRNHWRRFTSEQRKTVVELWIQLYPSHPRDNRRLDWTVYPSVCEALRSGDRQELLGVFQGLSTRPMLSDFHQYLTSYQLSLFGIAVPGGIGIWNPASLEAGRRHFLPDLTVVRLDVRGRLVVHPSASRLFVPDENAMDLVSVTGGVIIDHALSLLTAHEGEDAWKSWFTGLLASCRGISSAVQSRIADLNDHIEIHCRQDGEEIVLTPKDVIERFGQRVTTRSAAKRLEDGVLNTFANDSILNVLSGFKFSGLQYDFSDIAERLET